jgi:hypothetical protein
MNKQKKKILEKEVPEKDESQGVCTMLILPHVIQFLRYFNKREYNVSYQVSRNIWMIFSPMTQIFA